MNNHNAIIIFGGSCTGKSSIGKQFNNLSCNNYIELSELYKIARQICFQQLQYSDKILYNKYLSYADKLGDNFWSSILFNHKDNYFMTCSTRSMTNTERSTFFSIIPEIQEYYRSISNNIYNIRNKLIFQSIHNSISYSKKILINVSRKQDINLFGNVTDLYPLYVMCYCPINTTIKRAIIRNTNALNQCIASEWRSLNVILIRFIEYIDVNINIDNQNKPIEIIYLDNLICALNNASSQIYKTAIYCAQQLNLTNYTPSPDLFACTMLNELIFNDNKPKSQKLCFSIPENINYDLSVICDDYNSKQLAEYFNSLLHSISR